MGDDYFIKVVDGKGLRRKVLEASKGSINILRSYQNLLKIREEKLDLVEQLRSEMKELTVLVNRLSDSMPSLSKQDVKALDDLEKLPKRKPKKGDTHVYVGKPEKEKPKKSSKKEEKKEKVEKPKSKQEELHDKLQDIEKKLSKL